MQPAADALLVECAEVTVRLPETIGGAFNADGQPVSDSLVRRQTNAQATAAWGEPVSVSLWCGVEVPGPTSAECVSVNGIDWIVDDTEAPVYRFTTYGRIPAVTVQLDNTLVAGSTVLSDLSSAVSVTEAAGGCVGPTVEG